MSAQAKVGAFFIFAILILGYLTVMVGDVSVPGLSAGRKVMARFPRVDGLERGDAVTVAGMPAGEVKRMNLDGSEVIVEMELSPDIRLREDSKARIVMDSVLGGKVLAIDPGRSEVYLADGASIDSETSPGLEKALESLGKIGETAERIEKFIDDLDRTRTVLEERIVEISDKFVQVADGVEEFIDPLTEVAEGLAAGEGTIGRLLIDDTAFDDISRTLDNLSDITTEIREGNGTLGQLVYKSDTIERLNESLAPLREILAKVNNGEGTLGKAVNDPELYENLNKAFGAFSGAVSDIKVTMANMREITDKINKGQGTLGSLINDKETLKQLNDTMADVGEAAETLTDSQSLSVFLNVLGLAF